jgi:predicted secreted protein
MKGLLAFLLLLGTSALAQAPEPLFNLVTLTAQAERQVPNDLATAVLAAEADGTDTPQLASTVNRIMQAALAIARGYSSVQARSGNYQTSPFYESGRVVRWRVRQQLVLESTDIAALSDLVGKLQATLIVAGINLSVSPESRRRIENDLIKEAFAAFEERARIVRDAAREKSYRIRSVNVTTSGPIYPTPMAALARPAPASPSAMPAIEAGTSRILISVSGTIQLQ